MRTSVLANLIPRHVGAISPVIAPTAPIPTAIAAPFAAEPGGRDELRVTAQPLPDGRPDKPQVRFQFNDEVQVGDETVTRTFDEHFKNVQKYFESARQAREEHDWENVRFWYTSLFGALTATIDSETARPSTYFRHLLNGEDIYVESVIGVAIFASPGDSRSMLDHLGRARRMLKLRRAGAHGGEMTRLDGDLTRIKIMRANAIMRYADNIDELELTRDRADEFGLRGRASMEARHESYENAERLTKDGLYLIDVEAHKDHPATHYTGKLLLVDVLARQADRSFWRGDPDKEQKEIFDKLENAVRDITSGYEVLGTTGAEDAASHMADVATLFMRMNAGGRALKMARMLTDRSSDFAGTDHAKALLASTDFEDLVDSMRSEMFSNYQLRTRPGSRPVINRIKAALANTHSQGFLESLVVDGAGAALAGTAAHFLGAPPEMALGSAAVGAGLARMGMSVWNGWFSEQATSVGQTGLHAGGEVARDIGGLLGTGALHAGLMFPTAAFAVMVPDLVDIAWKQFKFAGKFYFGDMWKAETYSTSSASQGGNVYQDYFLHYFARPFGIATGAYYLTYLVPHKRLHTKMREFSNRPYIWPIIVAGGICAAGDASMTIAGTTDYFYRMGRGVIGTMAGAAMLMMGGIVALGKTGSWKESFSSIKDGFKELDKMNLVAASIMTGVSSAVGGHMERVADPQNPLLKFMQGAFINVTLLPLPFIMSGLLKRYINPVRGAVEGWQDAKGEGILRPYHAGKGFALAFWAPYVKNRGGRAIVPWYDWVAAGLRRLLPGGWDTNLGALVMSGYNIPTADSTGTMTWKETGRTDWEREAFRDLGEGKGFGKTADVTAKYLYHWSRAGQKMSVRHWTYPHLPWDKRWQYTAIERIWNPPKFPQYPDTQYFAGFLLQLMGKHKVELSETAVKQTLEVVKTLAEHPRNYADMRPVVQTLYAARARSKETGFVEDAGEAANPHGPQIWRFFEENPWILDLLNIDRTTFTPQDTKHRSSLELWAIRTLKLDRRQYIRRVREHRTLKGRVYDENKARKHAKKWAKEKRKQEQRGSWDEQKAKIMQELNKKGHVDLRRLEIALLGAKSNLYQGDGEDEIEKRNEQIRKLARGMAKKYKRSEVSLEQRQADIEMFLRLLNNDEMIWVQQLFLMSPRKAKRWRRRVESRLAGVILTNRRQEERVKKELELLREVAAKYATEEKKAERPIYQLFQSEHEGQN